MYVAKIPGTKYVTSLEAKGGQWYLRLKLDNTVEAELETELNNRTIKHKLAELFKQVSLQINNFQIDLIHKEIITQIKHLLIQAEQRQTQTKPKTDDADPRYDPRVDTLFEQLDKLETTLKTLTDRIERMEAITKD